MKPSSKKDQTHKIAKSALLAIMIAAVNTVFTCGNSTAIAGDDDLWQKLIHSDPGWRKFHGYDVTQPPVQDGNEELITHIKTNEKKIDFLPPRDEKGNRICYEDTSVWDLFLKEGSLIDLMYQTKDPWPTPSGANWPRGYDNKFVRLSHPYELELKKRILNSSTELSPAEVVDISLDVCKGNYPLAVLTAHNLLKHMTEEGRDQARKVKISCDPNIKVKSAQPFHFDEEIGNFCSKLRNIRPEPGDKMGIWYHAFIPLVFTAWCNRADLAFIALMGETSERVAKSIPVKFWSESESHTDWTKTYSDWTFVKAAREIHNFKRTLNRPPSIAICEACVNPEKGREGTDFTLQLMYQIQSYANAADYEPGDEGNQRTWAARTRSFPTINLNSNTAVSGPEKAQVDNSTTSEFLLSPPRNSRQHSTFRADTSGKYNFEYLLTAPDTPSLKASGSVPFEVTTTSNYLVRQGPFIQCGPRTEGTSVSNTDSSLTRVRQLYRGGPVRTTTITCEPPPAELKPGQKFPLKVQMTQYSGEESGWAAVYAPFVNTNTNNDNMPFWMRLGPPGNVVQDFTTTYGSSQTRFSTLDSAVSQSNPSKEATYFFGVPVFKKATIATIAPGSAQHPAGLPQMQLFPAPGSPSMQLFPPPGAPAGQAGPILDLQALRELYNPTNPNAPPTLANHPELVVDKWVLPPGTSPPSIYLELKPVGGASDRSVNWARLWWYYTPPPTPLEPQAAPTPPHFPGMPSAYGDFTGLRW